MANLSAMVDWTELCLRFVRTVGSYAATKTLVTLGPHSGTDIENAWSPSVTIAENQDMSLQCVTIALDIEPMPDSKTVLTQVFLTQILIMLANPNIDRKLSL